MSVIPYLDIIKIFQGQVSFDEKKSLELYQSIERILNTEYIKFDPYQCSFSTELQKQIRARIINELEEIPKLTKDGCDNVCTKKLLYLSYRVAILSWSI